MLEFKIYLLLTSPTWLEAFLIDPLFWRSGGSDKPWSTYIRGVLFLLVGISVDVFLGYGHWYYGIAIAFIFHVLAFQFMINLQLKRPVDYLGSGKYDTMIRGIPLWIRISLSVILLSASLLLFEIFRF